MTPPAAAGAGPARPSRRSQSIALLLLVGLCLAVEMAAAALTRPAIEPWYRDLAKPAWTPPAAAFPIVWTGLYLLMAAAAWQAWRAAPAYAGWPLACFFVQLALNGAWPAIFFALGDIAGAFLGIVALLLAIVATTVAFAQLDRIAGWLMVPYLLWVGYAGALNAAIVRMNL